MNTDMKAAGNTRNEIQYQLDKSITAEHKIRKGNSTPGKQNLKSSTKHKEIKMLKAMYLELNGSI